MYFLDLALSGLEANHRSMIWGPLQSIAHFWERRILQMVFLWIHVSYGVQIGWVITPLNSSHQQYNNTLVLMQALFANIPHQAAVLISWVGCYGTRYILNQIPFPAHHSYFVQTLCSPQNSSPSLIKRNINKRTISEVILDLKPGLENLAFFPPRSLACHSPLHLPLIKLDVRKISHNTLI